MVEPVNGKNPLVAHAAKIHLPMPGEEEPGQDDDGEYEDYEDEEEEYPDVDSEPLERPQPLSEDEKLNGVNLPPPDPEKLRRHRRRPMPRVPKPPEGEVFVPPFEVLEDGTVVGPTLGEPSDVLPPGFDPPRGSAEAMIQMVYAKPPQKQGGTG